jgi:hypothetical protein
VHRDRRRIGHARHDTVQAQGQLTQASSDRPEQEGRVLRPSPSASSIVHAP